MIICYQGTVGGGKTLSMTAEAIKYHRMGFKIYSNYALKGIPYIAFNKTEFEKFQRDKNALKNAVVLIDEAHIYIDSRRSQRNVVATYFFNQSRKRNLRVLMTSQQWTQLDIRLRRIINKVITCINTTQKAGLISSKKESITIAQVSEYPYSTPQRPPKVRYLKHAERLYPFYDTDEIIEWDEKES